MKMTSVSTGGMRFERKENQPMLDRQDGKIKSAMKSAMKLYRKNQPKIPSIMSKYEGM